VYLAGGIPAHLLPKLTDGRFMRAFVNKGRLSDLLTSMPVNVVTARAALLGAALYGLDQMQAA
jgi:glucokinase